VLILISQTQNGIERVRFHPITSFLYRRYSKSYTKKQEAYYITSFLNWILIDNVELFKIKDIYDLKFVHGLEYINEYSESVEKGTLKRCEQILTQLYYYLARKRVLRNVDLDKFEFADQYKEMIRNLFQGAVIYPLVKNKLILHNLPKGVLALFIDTAIMETPEIALGIYMQCFEGLRIGEIVNIVKSDISPKGAFAEYGMVVDLKDRYLRKELKHFRSGGGVKKVRK
jgi:integrase